MKKHHLAVLQDISRRIPVELTNKLIKTVKSTPSWEKDIKEFLETGTTKNKLLTDKFGKDKERLQNLFDAGLFSKTEQITDPKVEKEIDKWLDTEIDKAIKDGILPPRKPKLKKKVKQHAKRVSREQNQTSGSGSE